ncbi:MAG: hypothetical protein ABI838_09465, partial [Chloroflexota bacterium]
MDSLRLLCAVLVTALTVGAACGGGSQVAPAHSPVPAPVAQATDDPAFAGLIERSTDLGPAPADGALDLTLQLKDDT